MAARVAAQARPHQQGRARLHTRPALHSVAPPAHGLSHPGLHARAGVAGGAQRRGRAARRARQQPAVCQPLLPACRRAWRRARCLRVRRRHPWPHTVGPQRQRRRQRPWRRRRQRPEPLTRFWQPGRGQRLWARAADPRRQPLGRVCCIRKLQGEACPCGGGSRADRARASPSSACAPLPAPGHLASHRFARPPPPPCCLQSGCGRGDVDGDGVTPLCISQLPGADELLLPGVWHVPRGRGQLWYGDAAVQERWLPYLREPQASAAPGRS